MFDKVLVANRGEIAVRVIRACQEMGIRTVAVYSDADRLSPHVLLAGEAVRIGPAPAAESYLRADAILDAARTTGAQAIHPGYGFMAESPDFASRVGEAGLVFVGPPPEAIAEMGDKTAARARMVAAGVPVIPGSDALSEVAQGVSEGDRIGWPVLLKAVAGGGGKGMRVIESAADLPRSLAAASREAGQAFGDSRVYLEKYLADPRHIEIQVLADTHGRVIHLGERECSIQRRHQKLLEEAPSAVLTPEEREAMGQAAVRAAQAVNYRGAGTCEFLYQDGEFYFLEMNTRLQVEHPVTECVTGLDLVHWQLRVASGEALDFTQEDVKLTGHSIEVRITAEDAFSGFLPSTGRVDTLSLPTGPGVRWDGGIAVGTEVGLHYDPLLGKLIVHAPDRATAISRMSRALDELVIRGVNTCADFHQGLMDDADFRAGDLTIRFLEDHPHLLERPSDADGATVAASAAALLEHRTRQAALAPRTDGGQSGRMSQWRAFGLR